MEVEDLTVFFPSDNLMTPKPFIKEYIIMHLGLKYFLYGSCVIFLIYTHCIFFFTE